MTTVTYLHVQGTLAENMVYSPRAGHESSRPGRRTEGNPDFQLVLLDPEGHVLVTAAPEVKPPGCGAADDSPRSYVRGSIPLHPNTAAYELRKGEIVLYHVEVPSKAPIPAEPRCHHTAGGVVLHWDDRELTDTDTKVAYAPSANAWPSPARSITYSVAAVMESGQRLTLAEELKETVHSIDVSKLPIKGKGKLYLGTHDGVRSSEVEAGLIDVPARPPTVHILIPVPDARLPFGQPVSVLGCCLAMGGQPCSSEGISWSVDGHPFQAGMNVSVLENLLPGAHRITLSYGGNDDTSRVETSVKVEIDKPDADYQLWNTLTGSM
jgi:hypothetical protein